MALFLFGVYQVKLFPMLNLLSAASYGALSSFENLY